MKTLVEFTAEYISGQDRRNLFEAKDKPQNPADYVEFDNVRPNRRDPESQYAHTDPIDKYIFDNKIPIIHDPDDLYHEKGPTYLKEFRGVMPVREFGDGPEAHIGYYRVHKGVLEDHPDLHNMLLKMHGQAMKQSTAKR